MSEQRSLFMRIKEADPDAFNAYLEIISNKELAKRCNLNMTATTLADAFVWSEANRTRHFWTRLAEKLGEREVPKFDHPCNKFKRGGSDYG